ncbi:MAG: type II toxin-antitoxin system RelE/ParE family toxin [Spirosomaceae bacterium]|nr:type II toxin-antitoxin system RelE/ParE family toxin [Spirosomataceae bacterium]
MNKISWTEQAEDMYLEQLKFLLDSFPPDVALKFDEKVEQLIKRLQSFGELCPFSSKFPSLRKCRIDRYNSLVYRKDGHNIQIVALIDNRTNHDF